MGLRSPAGSQTSNVYSSDIVFKDEDARRSISAPFHFQHISHTEQPHLSALGRIEEFNLAAQRVHTGTTEQSTAPQLENLGASVFSADIAPYRREINSELSSRISESTTTPLLSPLQPSPFPNVDMRASTPGRRSSKLLSGNASNSRYLQLPQLGTTSGVNLSFSAEVARSLNSGTAEVLPLRKTTVKDFDSKPLPEPPVVHAVTTEDDSARAMKTTPLPTLPGASVPNSEANIMREQQHSSFSPRHTNFYPTAKGSLSNLLVKNDHSNSESLLKTHSDMALSEQIRNASTISSMRTSVSFGAIDTMNWEDAVDEAWDDAIDVDESDSFEYDYPISPRNNFEFITHLSTAISDEATSIASTPLMMAHPRYSPHAEAAQTRPFSCEKEDKDELTGLGILAHPSSGTTMNMASLSRSSSLHQSTRQNSLGYSVSSDMTRSSSQESLILSLASFTTRTQRSSNSSVNVDDICLSKISTNPADADKNIDLYLDQAYEKAQYMARPESGCLPLEVITQLCKIEALSDALEGEDDEVPALQPVFSMPKSNSMSRIVVPQRKSSVVGHESMRSDRRRTSTAQTKTRSRQSSRVSYSLFPVAQPGPPSTALST